MIDQTKIKKQFFNSLKRGTGEAYLLLKTHPAIDFSDLIIKGAIRNFAYDRQCEGSRATYIYKLINESKYRSKIVKAVLKKLESEKDDFYGLDQMCDLAVLFFKAGYKEARTTLYNRFEKNNLDDYQFCGQGQLIEIEGLAGVLKVAEVVGKILFEDPEDHESSRRIDTFQKANKHINVYKELEEAGKQNKYIQTYFESVSKNKWVLPKKRRKTSERFTYTLAKEKIDNKKYSFILSERANELSQEEVEQLAKEFLSEKDKKKQELYLRIFDKIKFPFGYEPIFRLASGKNSRDTRIVEFACDALKNFSNEEVRQFALDICKTKKNPYYYLPLLINNYKSGDYILLTEIASRSDNSDFIHSLVSVFVDIYKTNPTAECREPLEAIYNKMNCGIHRQDVIRLLANNNVLSEKIIQEIEFDSYSGVRELYQQMKKG